MAQNCAGDAPTMQELHALRGRLSSAELDQAHLFNDWPATPEEYTETQKHLLMELFLFGRKYSGGVEQYVRNGQRLLAEYGAEKKEYSSLEYPPNVYTAPSLFVLSEELCTLEREGRNCAKKTVFVLVAGGLGERLGYSGIKLSLPVETATQRTYLEHYLSWIHYIAGPDAPFVIMTSDDTHERTEKLLAGLRYKKNNIHLLKQETVFCFNDFKAHLAFENGKMLRKPHGHGDVHSLLYQAVDPVCKKKLIDVWKSEGYSYIVFLQDTNASSVLTIPISLALSARNELSMNFTCVPHQPKEAIGLVCKVVMWTTKEEKVVNIEYNKFESVMASTPTITMREENKEDGDNNKNKKEDEEKTPSLHTPFPGNINTIVMKIEDYVPLLTSSHGSVPEFINLKFTNEEKTKFKPCRIESLMQDFSLLFNCDKQRVGACLFTRFTYQPVKNALSDGIKKASEGLVGYCGTTGEESFYELIRLRLQAAGLKLPPRDNDNNDNDYDVIIGSVLKVKLFPIIVPDVIAMGVSLADIRERLLPFPENVHVSSRSVLIIEGRVRIESLRLDGALRLVGPRDEGAPPLVVKGMTVRNAGWTVRKLSADEDVDEVYKMRGFVLEEKETQTAHHTKL